MFVGEIGITRREFLYEVTVWEARRIIRGYRKRDRLKHQLLAECAYAAIYAMRDPKGKTAADIFPQLFEEDDDDEQDITEDEADKLRQLMAYMNTRHQRQQDRKSTAD